MWNPASRDESAYRRTVEAGRLAMPHYVVTRMQYVGRFLELPGSCRRRSARPNEPGEGAAVGSHSPQL